MEAGLNVARLNFSHGTHEQHAATVSMIREVARELNRPVAILGDLQGPRIRIGDLAEPRVVNDGEDIVLVAGEHATATQFPTTYELLCEDVKVGDRILFGKYSGTELKLNGEEYLMMREEDILGIMN